MRALGWSLRRRVMGDLVLRAVVGAAGVLALFGALVSSVRRPRKKTPAQLRRRYEWRFKSGRVSSAADSENACAYWLESYAGGAVVTRSSAAIKEDPDGSNTLRVHVAATGERVEIEGTVGERVRLKDEPDLPWFRLGRLPRGGA